MTCEIYDLLPFLRNRIPLSSNRLQPFILICDKSQESRKWDVIFSVGFLGNDGSFQSRSNVKHVLMPSFMPRGSRTLQHGCNTIIVINITGAAAKF